MSKQNTESKLTGNEAAKAVGPNNAGEEDCLSYGYPNAGNSSGVRFRMFFMFPLLVLIFQIVWS
jgi:hypothetical protein